MRLSDVVNQFRRRASEGTSFVRNPVQTIWRMVRKRGQTVYENAEVGGQEGQKKNLRAGKTNQGNDINSASQQNLHFRESATGSSTDTSREYFPSLSVAERPPSAMPTDLSRSPGTRPSTNIPDDGNHQPLKFGEVLKGNWGIKYSVGKDLYGKGWQYLYEGTQQHSNEAVWIYVYVLSEDKYDISEIDARREAFERITSANLKLGHDRDFRILKIEDAFRDAVHPNWCHLVVRSLPDALRLSQYLEKCEHENSHINPQQVKQLIKQILQSLKYLHRIYRVYWKGNPSEQGLCHGNLNLDSIWIRMIHQHASTARMPQFFVYLANFKLWEHVFAPSQEKIAQQAQDLGEFTDDLKALGWIAFSLLNGPVIDGKPINPQSPPKVKLQNQEYWRPQAEVLKPYILRLMGLGAEPSFESVEAAEAALINLSLEANLLQQTSEASTQTDNAVRGDKKTRAKRSKRTFSKVSWLLWFFLLGGASIATYFGIRSWLGRDVNTVVIDETLCSDGESCTLMDVNFPNLDGAVSFAVETSSSWYPVLERKLSSSTDLSTVVAFEDVIEERYPDLDLERQDFNTQLQSRANVQTPLPQERLVEEIQRSNLDFALIQAANGELASLPNELDFEVVAFDAIAVFVPFSDANRKESIPSKLEGTISVQELQDIFTGDGEQNFNQIKYKPYIQGFQYSDSQLKRDSITSLIEDFNLLLFDTPNQRNEFNQTYGEFQHTDIYSQLLQDFESQGNQGLVAGVGFDRFSSSFGQCSVYPLAIRHQLETYSLIVESDGQLLTPKTDLCGDKGSYWPNVAAFPVVTEGNKTRLDRSMAYPLSIELAVIYPKCQDNAASVEYCNTGQAFAKMLQTVEGQYLLSEMGLIPTIPIEDIRQAIWSEESN